MSQMWVISDHHLGHANIIRYCDRPFTHTNEMNEALRTYHNELVKPQDHVYFLGDVTIARGSAGSKQAKAFIEEMKKWNGHLRLIMGNHDHFPVQVYKEAGFEKIVGTGRWFKNILFSHYPVHPSTISTAIGCVHGHIHTSTSPKPHIFEDKGQVVIKPFINVCVDNTGFRPLAIETVEAMIVKVREEYLNAKVVTTDAA